jgi:hypothetical protein
MNNVTKEYKDYVLRGHPASPTMKVITRNGSGAVPKELQGLYTSFQLAIDAIDNYRPAKPKGKANGSKKHTTDGDEQVRQRVDNGSESVKLSS